MCNAIFNGIGIGDHAWLEVRTENEVEVHQIPRADGAIIRRRGGGIKNMVIHGWVVRNRRSEIEQYFDTLGGDLSSAVGDLIVNGKTYSNCILKSISPDSIHNRWARFTVTFFKSGD